MHTTATKIVRRLVQAGYKAYFAGGWVRDYLMGHPSDDIDIATDAPPEVIIDLFPSTILVGLAFGVIIVIEEGHQFEIATFRRDVEYQDGRKPSRIEPSTPEEDASRRDFTINGMFYDPVEEVIYDYVGGKEDLKHGCIRTIGDPYERFMEDRLRMIRAIRFSARFGFAIDPDTQEAIRANSYSLFPAVAMERVWQELIKMSKYPHFDHALIEMHRLELLPTIFPQLKGVHLHDIKEQVAGFQHYHPDCETMLFIMALFPHIGAQEALDLGLYLRTGRHPAQLAEYLVKLRAAVVHERESDTVHKVNWVHLYAHPAIERCLSCIAAHMSQEQRILFEKNTSTKKRLPQFSYQEGC